MIKKFFAFVVMLLISGHVLAFDTKGLEEVPTIAIEQALVLARQYVASEKIDVSRSFLAKVEWQWQSGLMSFWLVEWRRIEFVDGGQVYVKVFADGTIEYTFGE